MTMDEARAVLSLGSQPIFKIEDVAEAVGLAPTTIRNWIDRGHIELLYSRLFGRGTRSYFAYYDVILIMIAAELSHLGIKPMDIRSAITEIHGFVNQKISEAAGTWGDPKEHPDYENFHRYVALYYTGDKEFPIESSLLPNLNTVLPDHSIRDVTRIIIDCKMLAEKAMHIFKTLPRAE